MPIEPDALAERVPEGVYLDMPEADYFAQPALGSSDFKTLYQKREGWWWQSRHNRDRVQKDSPDLIYGAALHAILLEGVDAYERRFAVQPSKRDYPNLLTTIEHMKAALAEAHLAAEAGDRAALQQGNVLAERIGQGLIRVGKYIEAHAMIAHVAEIQ